MDWTRGVVGLQVIIHPGRAFAEVGQGAGDLEALARRRLADKARAALRALPVASQGGGLPVEAVERLAGEVRLVRRAVLSDRSFLLGGEIDLDDVRAALAEGTGAVAAPEGQRTLVVDARGLGLTPSLLPVIRGADGHPLVAGAAVPVRYVSAPPRRDDGTVTAKATAVRGAPPCDPVLGPKDAARVAEAAPARVVVVVEAEAGR